MSEHVESLLVLSTNAQLKQETLQFLEKQLRPIADKLGAKPLVVDNGMQVGIHSDIRPLIADMLEEQRKTNQLLTALIEAMGDEGDLEVEPQTYLSGAPIHKEPPHVEFIRKR